MMPSLPRETEGGTTLSRIVPAVILASGRASFARPLVAQGAALKDMAIVCEMELERM